MVDIEVVELLDSSEDEAPPMRAEPDIQEVTVDRQIRAPEAAAGGDDDDDVIVTGPYPQLAPRPLLESAPTTRRLPYRATPRALTGVLDVAQPSVERAALRSPRCQRKRARGSFLQTRDLTRVPPPPPRLCSSLPSPHRHGGRRRAGGLPAPATRVRGVQVRDHEPPHALPQLLVRRERRTARLSPSPTIVSSRVPRCPVTGSASSSRRRKSATDGVSNTFSAPVPDLPVPAATPRRCYCCDVQAPCRDWAIHCDARLARTSGTPCADASSPAARRRAPETFPARTPRRRPAAPPPPSRAPGDTGGGSGGAEPHPRERDGGAPSGDHEDARPGDAAVRLPAGRREGARRAPGRVHRGDAGRKLGRGARFGVRCSNHETMCKYLHERMNDTGAHFGLLNLLNTTGGQFAANGCTSSTWTCCR